MNAPDSASSEQQAKAQQVWANYQNGNISFHDLREQLDSLDTEAVAAAPGVPDQVPATPADVPADVQPTDPAVPLAPDDPARVPSPADTPAPTPADTLPPSDPATAPPPDVAPTPGPTPDPTPPPIADEDDNQEPSLLGRLRDDLANGRVSVQQALSGVLAHLDGDDDDVYPADAEPSPTGQVPPVQPGQ